MSSNIFRFIYSILLIMLCWAVVACGSSEYTLSPSINTSDADAVFSIYTEKGAKSNHYVPSNWMGDTKDISFDDGCTINPHSGNTCIEIAYSADMTQRRGWAGIYWADPPNNWGEKDGGFNLSGKAKLTFWARGFKGGEKAEFKVGGLGRDPDTGEPNNRFYDSLPAASIGPLTLTSTWQRYVIELSQWDLNKVMGGFVWVTNTTQNPGGATIYLDDIQFE